MRIAALYDIHGNLPALEAVLDDVGDAAADAIVVGGDVLPGPMPREAIAALHGLALPVHFIHGNGERDVLAHLDGRGADHLPERVRAAVGWTGEQLSPAQRLDVAAWPPTVRFEITGLGEVLFCHATPRSADEIFTRVTPEEHLLPVFAQVGVPVVVCGHTHMQFDRSVGTTRVVNAGSVGMPFGGPGAHWLLLDRGVELRRTRYDLAVAAERIRATEYPQAEEFAAFNVLRPPSETEMLEVLERASLRQP